MTTYLYIPTGSAYEDVLDIIDSGHNLVKNQEKL